MLLLRWTSEFSTQTDVLQSDSSGSDVDDASCSDWDISSTVLLRQARFLAHVPDGFGAEGIYSLPSNADVFNGMKHATHL